MRANNPESPESLRFVAIAGIIKHTLSQDYRAVDKIIRLITYKHNSLKGSVNKTKAFPLD